MEKWKKKIRVRESPYSKPQVQVRLLHLNSKSSFSFNIINLKLMRSLCENDGVQFSVARQVVLGFLIRSASTPIDQPQDEFVTFESWQQ